MKDAKSYKKEIPFNGKLNTALDPAQIGDNFQTLKNMRYKKAGLSPVAGMTKINTSVWNSTYDTPTSVHHFRKSNPSESHLLIEATSGSASRIYQNETAIPSAGNFTAASLYTPDSSTNGGRWSDAPNGMVAYANGREVCLWGGDELRIGAFVTSTASVTNRATNPIDYTERVRNDLTSTNNVVSLDGASYWLIGSPLPLQGVKIYVSSANATAGSTTVQEWTGSAWSALSVTDNTASGGATLAQTGTMTWSSTESTSKIRMIYGMMLYWYQFSATVTCSLSQVTLNAPFQTVKDIPDGVDRQIVSAIKYIDGRYEDHTIGVLNNEYDSNNEGTWSEFGLIDVVNDEYVYCGFSERLTGLAINIVPGYDNDNSGCVLSVDYWDGSAYQSVTGLLDGTIAGVSSAEMVTNGDCSADSFTKGTGWAHDAGNEEYDCDGTQVADSNLSQDISMTNGNDYLVVYTLSNVADGTLTPKCGTAEGTTVADDGTYTDVITCAGGSVLYFTADEDFEGTIDDISVKELTDTSFVQSGVVTWAGIDESDETMTEVTNSVPLYYYRLSFAGGGGLGESSRAYYIAGIPAQGDIANYDFPLYSNDRLWLCKDNMAKCSLAETANVFNGNESVIEYFGNEDKLTGGVWLYSQFGSSIYNISLFFKQSETWAIIGGEVQNWQKYRISTTVGCVAPKTIVSADITGAAIEGINRAIAIWQGAKGIYVSDGRQPLCISGDIEDRFDTRSSTCIDHDYIDDSTAFWDTENMEYHWLFRVGSGIDTEMVFSFKKQAWYEIDRTSGNELQLGVRVISTEGAEYVYGVLDDGYVERLEYGNDMDGTAIPFEIQTGDIAPAEGSVMVETEVEYHSLICAAKSNTSTNITVTHYLDSETSSTRSWTHSPNKSGYRLNMPVEHRTQTGVFHSWKFTTSTDDESYGFQPLYFNVIYRPVRDNKRDRR